MSRRSIPGSLRWYAEGLALAVLVVVVGPAAERVDGALARFYRPRRGGV